MNMHSVVTTLRPSESEARQPFDRATLDALILLCPGESGTGLLAQLLADFGRLEAGVRDCVARKDLGGLGACSHEIKGLAATLVAVPLTRGADAVQDACDNNSFAAAPGDLAEDLLTELRIVTAALRGMSGDAETALRPVERRGLGHAGMESASRS